MDQVIKQAITKMQGLVKKEYSWSLDEPWFQDVFSYSNGKWVPQEQTVSTEALSGLALYSWNVDFMLPFPDSRMSQALRCLQQQVQAQDTSLATVIFLQECLQSDLDLLASHTWVQENFYLSDLDTSNWTSSYYGTVTLVDKRLSIEMAFRLHYAKTNMQRDAFFTIIKLGRGKEISLVNCHLESMAFEPPMRPHQMALAAKFMHETHGGVMAGDFNAIQDFDRHLHFDNGLRDAYLELGGSEDSNDGYTWGQQASTALRQQFGLCRMDKIVFCGGLTLQSFERFDADVEVEDEDEQRQIQGLGFEKAWITDHLGVKAIFQVGYSSGKKL